VNKPRPARALAELAHRLLADSFAKQGFAASELVTRWETIAGPEIAAHAEPIKIIWPRRNEGEPAAPATLVLRVEGPTAVEIQHLAPVIMERVNRFFGWQAVGRIALRQAPLSRRKRPAQQAADPAVVARIAAGLDDIADEGLRQALARLGAALERDKA